MASQAAVQNVTNRWLIVAAGVVMQIALGSVYTWSVFRIPLSNTYGTSVSAVNTTFSITLLAVSFGSFFGGLWMNRSGPRIVDLPAERRQLENLRGDHNMSKDRLNADLLAFIRE